MGRVNRMVTELDVKPLSLFPLFSSIHSGPVMCETSLIIKESVSIEGQATQRV